MDDSSQVGRGNGDKFEHVAVPCRPDCEESFVAAVVVLDETNGVGPGVPDVLGVDAVLVGGSPLTKNGPPPLPSSTFS